VHSAARGSHAV